MGKPTRVPQLARPIIKDNPELQRAVDAIIETMEVREGRRGHKLDRGVTFRDLTEGGVASLRTGGSGLQPPAPDSGGTPGSDELPTMDGAPPALKCLHVVGSLGVVFVTWCSLAGRFRDFAYTNVYRATTPDFGAATLLGTALGGIYVDHDVTPGVQYCYWVTAVGTDEAEGPINATAGTCATVIQDPGYLLDLLEGEITESQLFATLGARIDLIDTPVTGLMAKTGALQSQMNSVEGQLAELEGTPEFDPDVAYAVDEMVIYLGSLYRCTVATTVPSALPTDPAHWSKVGDYTSLSGAVAGHAATLSDHGVRITATEEGLGLEATRVDELLAAQESDFGINAARLIATQAATTSEMKARADTFTGLSALIFDEAGVRRAAIETVEQAIVTGDEALAAQYTQLEAQFGGDTANALNFITSHVDANSATAGKATALESQFGGDTANALNFVTSHVSSNSALASDVTQLSLDVDGVTAAVQTKAEVGYVDGVFNTEYTVKLDNNGLVSGFGLMNTGQTSSFGVRADQFWIAGPNDVGAATPSAAKVPFIVRTTPTVINGEEVPAGTYIRSAMIEYGVITELHVRDGFLTNLTADKGVLAASSLANTTINQAYISGDIQSGYGDTPAATPENPKPDWTWVSTYVPGSTGWIIRNNGSVEFNNGAFRGHVEMDSGHIASGVSIGGIGAFAYKDSLFYNEVMGTKPPSDADRTGANTAADTANVGGTPAWQVRNQAAEGNSAYQRVYNSWTRPTSTLIDGNKIFTGDAYVDTLQIKGQAVTIPASDYAPGAVSLPRYTWVSLASASILSSGAPIVITLSAYLEGGGAGEFEGVSSLQVRLLENGNQVFSREGLVETSWASGGARKMMFSFTLRRTPGAGTRSYVFQAYQMQSLSTNYAGGSASHRAIVVMETKR